MRLILDETREADVTDRGSEDVNLSKSKSFPHKPLRQSGKYLYNNYVFTFEKSKKKENSLFLEPCT